MIIKKPVVLMNNIMFKGPFLIFVYDICQKDKSEELSERIKEVSKKHPGIQCYQINHNEYANLKKRKLELKKLEVFVVKKYDRCLSFINPDMNQINELYLFTKNYTKLLSKEAHKNCLREILENNKTYLSDIEKNKISKHIEEVDMNLKYAQKFKVNDGINSNDQNILRINCEKRKLKTIKKSVNNKYLNLTKNKRNIIIRNSIDQSKKGINRKSTHSQTLEKLKLKNKNLSKKKIGDSSKIFYRQATQIFFTPPDYERSFRLLNVEKEMSLFNEAMKTTPPLYKSYNKNLTPLVNKLTFHNKSSQLSIFDSIDEQIKNLENAKKSERYSLSCSENTPECLPKINNNSLCYSETFNSEPDKAKNKYSYKNISDKYRLHWKTHKSKNYYLFKKKSQPFQILKGSITKTSKRKMRQKHIDSKK